MVAPVRCDNLGLTEGVYEEDELGINQGTYTECGESAITTYSVTEVFEWVSGGGCETCDSLAVIYKVSPGPSGSAHPNCRCTSTKALLVEIVGVEEGATCARCGKFFYIDDMQGSYCLDCVEIVKEALEDGAEGCFWTGVVLTGGGIVIALIPGFQLLGGALALLGLSAFGMDRYASEAADDPPDESYKEKVDLKRISVKLPEIREGEPDIGINRAIMSFVNSCANIDALRVSMERFTYAAGVYDKEYINLQSESVVKYRDELSKSLQEQITALNESKNKIIDSELDGTIEREHIKGLQEKLITDGFSDEQLDVFKEFGMDMNSITELKQKIINANPDQFVGKLSDLLSRSVANLETLRNKLRLD